MASEIKRLLRARTAKKATFNRQCLHSKVTLKDSWRAPMGLHSKQRKDYLAKGEHPEAGFGSPKAVRGFHPSGYREERVFTVAELENIDPATTAVRIGASVGFAKRNAIQAKAAELGIKVLNVKVQKPKVAKVAAPAAAPAVEAPKTEEAAAEEAKTEEVKAEAPKAEKKARKGVKKDE